MIIPSHLTGKDKFAFIVKNEAAIIEAKKSALKKADACSYLTAFVNDRGELVSKAEIEIAEVDVSKLRAVLVINTTNILDSHGDVHIPGLWNKSLSDNRRNGFKLLKSHGRDFEYVIGDEFKGETRTMNWTDVGKNYPGTTEALVFTGVIEKARNSFMFDQYRMGYVKQHSVGMRYVKLLTCVNDNDFPVQKENWDKYRPMVINGADADGEGCFWAVIEAKIIEGSAVLFGSNSATPSLQIEDYEGKNTDEQPEKIIANEPLPSTQKQSDNSTEIQPNENSFLSWLQKTNLLT
jgi:hypothetical protein